MNPRNFAALWLPMAMLVALGCDLQTAPSGEDEQENEHAATSNLTQVTPSRPLSQTRKPTAHMPNTGNTWLTSTKKQKTQSAATAPSGPTCGSTRCAAVETCDAATKTCVPNCPKGEVYVPATGPEGFIMGRFLRGNGIDSPHRVVLTRPFCMDATEVTVRAYKRCVEAKACTKPRLWGMWRNYPKLDDHPVNKVDWKQATAYCAWRKQSLPSEAQWEWAATGGDGRKWAWGSEPINCERADYTPGILRTPSSDDGCNGGGTSPVATHPKGDRIWPHGRIHDLTGNVWEWCIDNYGKWTGGKQVDPVHMKYPEGVHVVRGGGWNRSSRGVLAHYRGGAVVGYRVPGLGFRCVRNHR